MKSEFFAVFMPRRIMHNSCMESAFFRKYAKIGDNSRAPKRIEEKMVTREDIEAVIDSIETLNNPTMEALRGSNQDTKAGRVREIIFKELLDEL